MKPARSRIAAAQGEVSSGPTPTASRTGSNCPARTEATTWQMAVVTSRHVINPLGCFQVFPFRSGERKFFAQFFLAIFFGDIRWRYPLDVRWTQSDSANGRPADIAETSPTFFHIHSVTGKFPHILAA